MCNGNCNRLCPNYIISNSVTVVTIDGVDTLVIDIPAGSYRNCCKYCLVVAQNIPDTATVTMPVSISIGGDTTTVYPLVCNRTCLQAVACQIRSRTKYTTVVQTNTTSGVFRVIYGLGSYCPDVLSSLPIETTATANVADVASFSTGPIEITKETPNKTTRTITNTTKEVIIRE